MVLPPLVASYPLFARPAKCLAVIAVVALGGLALAPPLHAAPGDGSANASANGGITASNAPATDQPRANNAADDQRARQRMLEIARREAGQTQNQRPTNNTSSAGSRPDQQTATQTSDGATAKADQPPANDPTNATSASSASSAEADQLDKQFPQRTRSLGGTSSKSNDEQSSASDWTEQSSGWVLETLTALGIVIGLILLTRWAWMKLSGQVPSKTTAGASRSVEVLSRTAVAPKNHVLLLRVGQRVLVVGDSSNGLNTLAEVDDPEEVADLLTTVSAGHPNSLTGGFRQALSRVSGQFDQRTFDEEDGRDDAEHHFDRSRSEVSSLLSRVRALAGRGGSR
jgi:flagellar biogenesis protein FliO